MTRLRNTLDIKWIAVTYGSTRSRMSIAQPQGRSAKGPASMRLPCGSSIRKMLRQTRSPSPLRSAAGSRSWPTRASRAARAPRNARPGATLTWQEENGEAIDDADVRGTDEDDGEENDDAEVCDAEEAAEGDQKVRFSISDELTEKIRKFRGRVGSRRGPGFE